tara:strand:- start:434 stop:1612 length:1179 start_codon:yes stop_codon:yes gene_type:complete
MTYLNGNGFLVMGTEQEISTHPDSPYHHRSFRDVHRDLHNDGFTWVNAKDEYNVKTELIIPPFNYHSTQARSDISDLFTWLTDNRFKVGGVDNGGHINVGLKSIVNATPDQHWQASKNHATDMLRVGNNSVVDTFNNENEMPLLLAKDVATRYATHKDQINAFLPRSRWDHRYVKNIDHIAINARHYNLFMESNVRECNNIVGGKFHYVNFDKYDEGRIEFRQPQATLNTEKLWRYCEFIDNLFQHSDKTRINYDSANNTNLTSPSTLYRYGSRIHTLYSLARVEGGASTQSLMNSTGWDAPTIRARFSEMRDHPDLDRRLIVQHDQQTNGHRYGSSDGRYDQNGYEVLRSLELIGNLSLHSLNRIGTDSIWGSMSDECFEYFHQRRINLGN